MYQNEIERKPATTLKQTDRFLHKQRKREGGEGGREGERETHTHTETQTNRQTQTGRQRQTQTDRNRDRLTERQTDGRPIEMYGHHGALVFFILSFFVEAGGCSSKYVLTAIGHSFSTFQCHIHWYLNIIDNRSNTVIEH